MTVVTVTAADAVIDVVAPAESFVVDVGQLGGPPGPPGADSTVPGPQGPPGADSTVPGPQGPPGADSTVPGPQGPPGATGSQGPQGVKGDTGTTGTTGSQGPQGNTGATGPGVAAGGTTGQALTKTSGTDFATGWATLTKTSVGLGNVDNTADTAKPVSTAQQTALDAKVASTTIDIMWTGNQTAYDAIGTKDPATMYVIV